MDTEKRQVHISDILSNSPFSQSLTHLNQADLLVTLPLVHREAVLQAFSQGESVALAREATGVERSATLTVSISGPTETLLAALLELQQELAAKYGCHGLCLAEGRLVSGGCSAPLLLHPVELSLKQGRWLLRRGHSLTLHNPCALDLLPEGCPVPEEGWSYQGEVLAHQLDAAIAQAPGCIREDGFYLSLFPLWAIDLEAALAQPAPKHTLAAGLEASSVRTVTDVPDCSDTTGEDGILTPLPLDGTQMTALRLLMQGEHLLVSGKRGTGKTQLAAGLAANAIGNRQQTLLIAPKEQDRLSFLERMKELGLDGLCLHIPSTGDRKQAVLHQYNVAAQLRPSDTAKDFFSLSEQSAKLSRKLDRHLAALHNPGRCGLTPWELICRYLEVKDTEGCVDLPELVVSRMDQKGLEQALAAAKALTLAAEAVETTVNHPLSLIQGGDYSEEKAVRIPYLASELHSAMKTLEAAAADWCRLTGLAFPVAEADWSHLEAAGRLLQDWMEFPEGWRASQRIALLPEVIQEFRTRFDKAEGLQAAIDERWEHEVFAMDALLLEKQWRSLQDQWTLPTDPAREETLYQLLEQSGPLLNELEQAGRRWAASTHAPVPTTRDSWERYYEVALELARWKEIPREWGSCSNLRALLWDVGELIRHGKQAKESKEVLLRTWEKSFLTLNGRDLTKRWEKEGGNWGLGWLKLQSPVRTELEEHYKGKLTTDVLESGLRWLVDYQDELAQCDEIFDRWEQELKSVYKREETVWVWLENARIVAAESHDWLAELTGSQDFLRKYGSSAEAVSAAQAFQQCWEKARDVLGRLNVIIGRPTQPDSPSWLSERRNDCRRLHTMIKLRRQLEDLSKVPLTLGDIAPALRLFSRHQKERAAIASLYERWQQELEEVYFGADTDWDVLYHLSLQASESDEKLGNLTGDLELRLHLAAREDAQNAAEALRAAWADFRESLDAFAALTTARLGRGSGSWLNLIRGDIAVILEHLPELGNWMNWQKQCQLCRTLELDVFVSHFDTPIPEQEDTYALFCKSLYRALLVLEMDWAADLRSFSARQMGDLLRRYAKLDEAYTQRIREELFHVAAAQIPQLFREAQYEEELALLLWANQTNGQDISLEELIQSLPLLTRTLFSCVAASPTDALRCFKAGEGAEPRFDYAVLDGADQLPASVGQSVTGLARTALLISHDRQKDYPAFSKEESIYARCAAHHLPELKLDQSYLLHQESLHWLEQQLFGLKSYPSCEPRAFHIQYKTVVGQMKKKTNPAEAAAVAAHTLTLVKDGKCQFAIVAVTKEQRNLIRTLLSQSAADAPESAEALTSIPVFTPGELGSRRYEQVLLSLTLAGDKKDRFTAARDLAGSWTDLEPVVDTLAAARKELILFSSLDRPDWKKLRNNELTAFLTFVQDQALPFLTERPYANRIQQEVCEAFTSKGYLALPCEEPLAIQVFSPEKPDRCLLGILMDGDGYGAIPRTKERELDRIELLQQLDWNLCRLWSIDWLQNPDRVLSQMVRLLEAISEQPELSADSAAPTEAPAPHLYTPAHLAAIGIRDEELSVPFFRNRVSMLAEETLHQEAPLPSFRLTERVLTAFGLNPEDEILRTQCDTLWELLEITMTEENGSAFAWDRQIPPEQYTDFRISGKGEHYRAPDEVSAQEAANAATSVLTQAVTLTPLRLAQETARLLGYDPEDEVALACGKRGVEYALSGVRFHETPIGTLVCH